MIYYFKDERGKALEKIHKAERDFLTKYPNGEIFCFSTENFSLARWEELLTGGGLFAPKFLIIADNLLSDKEIGPQVEPTLELAKTSENVFIFLETPAVVRPPAGGFNIWAPTEALARRDRKALWLLYQEAQVAGISAEEFFWKLAWKTKMLLLAKRSDALVAQSGKLIRLWHDYRREAHRDFTIGLERFILEV